MTQKKDTRSVLRRILFDILGGILLIIVIYTVINQAISQIEWKRMNMPGYRVKTVRATYYKIQNMGDLPTYDKMIKQYPDSTFDCFITNSYRYAGSDIYRLSPHMYMMCYSAGTRGTLDMVRTLDPLNAVRDIARIAYDPTNGIHSDGNRFIIVDTKLHTITEYGGY